MTIGTKISTFFKGRHVGTDAFGNRYFIEKKIRSGQRTRRWVMYKGVAEPSKVPPMWNAWLHYTVDQLPTELSTPHYAWEKEHVPNLSGTAGAYLPPGHIRMGSDRASTVADYQAWTPGE